MTARACACQPRVDAAHVAMTAKDKEREERLAAALRENRSVGRLQA